MALNIKNPAVVQLAGEVAKLAKETKTEAIRRAIEERKARLRLRAGKSQREGLQTWLETEVWPKIPEEARGRPLSKEQEEEILGFGPDGF